MKRQLKQDGFTFIEAILASLILFLIFQMSFSLLLFQKKFTEDNFLRGEYQRQLNFAESWLRRDFFESRQVRALPGNELEFTSYSGEITKYYLASDPYQSESWKKKSQKTLYRKQDNEKGQPLTQFNSSFLCWEENFPDYKKINLELYAGELLLKMEEVYE